jgi:zinc/manganese transport system substrate-binding protein
MTTVNKPVQQTVSPLGLLILPCILMLSATSQAALKVVTTVPDLAALVAEVGGEHVKVTTMSSPDQDPHYVDPKPSLVIALARADLLVFNGLDLEIGWLPPIQANSRNAAIQKGGAGYFDASSHIDVLEIPVEANRAMGDIHPGGNPHYLYDPRQGALVAIAIGDKLAELIPKQSSFLRKNAQSVADKLKALAKEQKDRFAKLSPEQLKVVTYHRSLVYILDWLGIKRPINVEPLPGIAPTPRHVARVLSTMRAQNIKVILQERHYPTRTSDTLARMTKAKVAVIPGGANYKRNQKELYTDRIRRTAEVIYAALSR